MDVSGPMFCVGRVSKPFNCRACNKAISFSGQVLACFPCIFHRRHHLVMQGLKEVMDVNTSERYISACEICPALEETKQVEVFSVRPTTCPKCTFIALKRKTNCPSKSILSSESVPVNGMSISPPKDVFPVVEGDCFLVVHQKLDIGPVIRIQVHGFILAGQSTVVRKLMETDLKDLKQTKEIPIYQYCAALVRAVRDGLYTGDIIFQDCVNPEDVLRFVGEYGMSSWIKEKCQLKLVDAISADNIHELLRISKQYKLMKLYEESDKFLRALEFQKTGVRREFSPPAWYKLAQ